MQEIKYGCESAGRLLCFYSPIATLKVYKSFISYAKIGDFKKFLKFVCWMYISDPETLDTAVSEIHDIIYGTNASTTIGRKHLDAINDIRRKHGI